MRKPSTPDPIKMIYLQGEQKRRIKTPKIYPTNNMMNNNKKKIYTFTKNKGNINNSIIRRPSTAPQKEKTKSSQMKSSTIKSSTLKRAPSPMLHSNNLNNNMKPHPERFRVPSPMLKSSSFKIEPYKRGGF